MHAKSDFSTPEELMAYLDGELTPARAERIRTHLEQCPECQREIDGFEQLSRRLQEWTVETRPFPAPVFTPELHRPTAFRLGKRGFWGLAAAFGLIAVIVVSIPRFHALPAVGHQDIYRAGRNARALADRQPEALQMDAKQPQLAYTARLSLVVKDLNAAESAVTEILRRHHSYMAQMNVAASPGALKFMDASVRTPEAELQSVTAEIKALGLVESEARQTEDVTRQSVDLDARLANERNSLQRLQELLRQRTGNLQDVLAVESQVETTQGEIERMTAERKDLTARVLYARLDLHVSQAIRQAADPAPGSWWLQIRNAGRQGLKSLGETALDLTTWALSSGPSLLLWLAILFFGLRFLWRRFGARFDHLGRNL
jgi:hypothetical protein